MRKIFALIIASLYMMNVAEGGPIRNQHRYGRAIAIQYVDDNGNSFVDYEALRNLFLRSEVKHRKIVTMSIAGAFRKGKSFFLDYCLRFLYANYRSVGEPSGSLLKTNWNEDENEPLTGFSWKHGSKADTNGILMWSDIFLYDADDGERIAIALIDTQGLFEPNKPAIENSRIFGLSSLISSTQIYNLMEVIQENELEHLEMTIKFAKFIASRANQKSNLVKVKPFQNLLFLVRDWSDDDYDFGYEGGQKYLQENVLNLNNSGSNMAAQSVRENIHNSFESVRGFLLPHPGSIIKKKSFDGSWKQLDREFVNELEKLIESLLSPNHLVKKKIFNREITAENFYDYVFAYFRGFENEELPEISSLYDMTVNRQMVALIEDLLDEYRKIMEESLDFDDQNLENSLSDFHYDVKFRIILKFANTPKVGDDDDKLMQKYKEMLAEKLDKMFTEWRRDILRALEERKRSKEAIQQMNLNHEREKELIEENAREMHLKLSSDFQQKLELEQENRRSFEQRMLTMFMLNGLKETIGSKAPEWAKPMMHFATLVPMLTSNHTELVNSASNFLKEKFSPKNETTS